MIDNDDDDSDDDDDDDDRQRFDEKKNPISDVSSNVFSTFSSHYIQKGNSTKGKNMNLEQNSRDSRHFR